MRARKTQTSKKILWLDFTIGVIVTAAVIIGNFRGLEMGEAAIVAGLWDGQLALAFGFYYWKAKNENRSKHAMDLVRELADKYGMDATARIAEIVLKE